MSRQIEKSIETNSEINGKSENKRVVFFVVTINNRQCLFNICDIQASKHLLFSFHEQTYSSFRWNIPGWEHRNLLLVHIKRSVLTKRIRRKLPARRWTFRSPTTEKCIRHFARTRRKDTHCVYDFPSWILLDFRADVRLRGCSCCLRVAASCPVKISDSSPPARPQLRLAFTTGHCQIVLLFVREECSLSASRIIQRMQEKRMQFILLELQSINKFHGS